MNHQFCNERSQVLYTNPMEMNDTTNRMRGRILDFLAFRCNKSPGEVLGKIGMIKIRSHLTFLKDLQFAESEEEIVRAYENYRAQEEAESGESNLTRIVAGILFKEFSEQGNFNYQIRLGVETFELESRTKEMRMISTTDINFYLTFQFVNSLFGFNITIASSFSSLDFVQRSHYSILFRRILFKRRPCRGLGDYRWRLC